MKRLALPIAAIFLLGGAIYTARTLGFSDAANFLDAKAAQFAEEYRAAKAEASVSQTAPVAAE